MSRAVSPLLGTLLLAGITVLLAAVVGVAVLDVVPSTEQPDNVVMSATADADGRVRLTHDAGPPLDVEQLSVRITVDGEPLTHQPPIPFFSASGFASGPTGPFNPSADQEWSLGERATLTIAGTNDPEPEAGDRLTVRLVRDDVPVVVVETTVEAA